MMRERSSSSILKPSLFYDKMSSYYDAFMNFGESTLEDEIALVVLTYPIPCKLLDIGCGTGRISLSLQEKEYDVTGLDISQGMLNEAVKKRTQTIPRRRFRKY